MLLPQDIALLQALADGKRYSSLVGELGKDGQALKHRAWRIRKKLGCDTVTNAVATALRQGLID